MQSTIFTKIKNYLSINDLFALTIVIMIAGHLFYFFIPDNLWLRIADRILVPLLMVSIGYNLGHKMGWPVYIGAALIMIGREFVPYSSPVNILLVFAIIKIILDPLARFLASDKRLFWGVNAFMAIISPFANNFSEYGTLAIIMAMAGWINRNQDEVKHITSVSDYYLFSYFSFLWFTWAAFGFSGLQMICIASGLAFVMWLLLDYRTLIMNAIKRKPKDIIERICSFLARKSLEIYVFHVLSYMLIVYYFTHNLS